MQDLRDTMKYAREDLGLKASELAARCGVHAQQIRNYENRECYPPKHAFKALCETLELDYKRMVKIYMAEKERDFLSTL